MKRSPRVLHALVILLNRKVAGRPFGIWIAWAALISTAASYSTKLRMVSASAYLGWPLLSELIGIWPAIIAAAVTLAQRKLIAVAFGGIALGFLFYHALFHSDLLGSPWPRSGLPVSSPAAAGTSTASQACAEPVAVPPSEARNRAFTRQLKGVREARPGKIRSL